MHHSSTVPLPPRAWLTVALLCVVGALNYLDRTMITTMRSSILAAIPMSDARFGLLTSSFLWVYGLLSPVAGWLADRFSRSRVIIASLLVWSTVTFLTSLSSTFGQLLATRLLMGVSEACYIPAALALISDYHTGRTRSLATGIHIAGIYVGGSLGFLGGWISESHSWNHAFRVFGLVGIGFSAVLVLLLREAPRKAGSAGGGEGRRAVRFDVGVRGLLSRRTYWYMLLFWGMMGIIGWMVIGWLPTYYKEQFHLSQGVAGLYATGYLYPASVAGLIFAGYVADRWSRTNALARIYVPLIGVVVAAPFIFLGSNTGLLPLAIGCFIIYAFTFVFTDANLMPILCMVADERYRATGYGILNMFATIIGGIGLFTGGYLRDAQVSLSLIYGVAALILLACGGMLYLISLRIRRKNETSHAG